MKRMLIIAVLTIAAAALSACNASRDKAASSAAATAPSANVEQEIKQIEQEEWVQADLKKDVAWYERHFADEYVATNARTGKVTNKAEDLADIKNDAKDPATGMTSETIEVRKVQTYGDVAVATGKFAAKGKDKDGPFDRQGFFTDVWVKRGGRWQLVATHSNLALPTTK